MAPSTIVEILQALLKLWPLYAFALAVYLLSVAVPILYARWRLHRAFEQGEQRRSDQEVLQWLRGLKPTEFERYVAHLFAKLGYVTRVTGRPNDGGIDIEVSKGGITSYIQCKKFISTQVSASAMRDFYGAVADRLHRGGHGYFVTTNVFTLAAQQFAEAKPIELIDGAKLITYIRLATSQNAPGEKDAPEHTMVCPECGSALLRKTGKFGAFIGCSKYPTCRYTRNA